MIIKVKHKNTEIEVKDDGIRTDTNNNLIYYNQKYIIELLTEIINNIKILNL
tara:strand:- start:7788 stop:7943 length:156 start_codon:yes stop_codon:yes gene_type:complete